MRAPAGLVAIWVVLACGEAFAASVGLTKLETKDLQLIYVDPDYTYLTPYAARSYENSLAFQRKIFAWTPWDRPTILLFDISDSGASTTTVPPTKLVRVAICPIPTTFAQCC